MICVPRAQVSAVVDDCITKGVKWLVVISVQLNLGISTLVSVGNKADVSGNDLIQ